MKLDLLYEVDVPKPWPLEHPYGQRQEEQKAFKDTIEQIKLADRMGFNCTWHVEHHFREGRSHSSAPEVLIGALSQVTERIRLGFGVTLLPHEFGSPVRVAERVATADVLSGGRVEWGTGRSTPMEQSAFGVNPYESKAQAQEAIRAIVQAWESEYFSFHGKYWDFPVNTSVPHRMVTPKPFQDPHPPAWMAAVSKESAALAGHLGLGLLSLSHTVPVEKVAEQIAEYRNANLTAEPITRVNNTRAAVYTLVHCADTMEQAEANGIWPATYWWYTNLRDFTLQWEFPNATKEEKEIMFPLVLEAGKQDVDPRVFADKDMIIVGDPEQCLEKMLKYEAIGVDSLLCYVQFGHLPHESVMRCIELLGTRVIPELERREIQVNTTVKAT